MSLRGFYESSWQQPNLLGALGLLLGGAAAWAASRHRAADDRSAFLARWTQLFALEALLDCVLTGYSSPLGQNTPAMTAAAVVFVILGDLRLYLLLARLSRPRWSAVAMAEALAASLAPSLVIAALKRVAPWLVANGRHIFLIYELTALIPLALWGFVLLPGRAGGSPAVRAWLRGAVGFFALQYALWASADVGILYDADLAWGLRVVPNAMYYAGFVAWVWRTAPRELRG
ncbi:MAG: hypothetical protein U0325_34970 [Polyangiales bacterium]